jgi:hypothetical protein
VTQVTVRATLVLPDATISRLETFTLDVPANGTVALRLGVVGALLLDLRVVDVRLKIAWAD